MLFRSNARETRAFLSDISLTMSYFHTGTRTIIGAESFHCPVRDGKEWDQLAMVIRLKLFTAAACCACSSSFVESLVLSRVTEISVFN